jgi:hypothetical protein
MMIFGVDGASTVTPLTAERAVGDWAGCDGAGCGWAGAARARSDRAEAATSTARRFGMTQTLAADLES